MISGIIGCQMLQRIPRERISTVVINSFNSGECEIPHGLAIGHHRCQEPYSSPSSVKKESFNWVIVKSSKCIRDIKSVVSGVEGNWKVSIISQLFKGMNSPYNHRFRCIAR